MDHSLRYLQNNELLQIEFYYSILLRKFYRTITPLLQHCFRITTPLLRHYYPLLHIILLLIYYTITLPLILYLFTVLQKPQALLHITILTLFPAITTHYYQVPYYHMQIATYYHHYCHYFPLLGATWRCWRARPLDAISNSLLQPTAAGHQDSQRPHQFACSFLDSDTARWPKWIIGRDCLFGNGVPGTSCYFCSHRTLLFTRNRSRTVEASGTGRQADRQGLYMIVRFAGSIQEHEATSIQPPATECAQCAHSVHCAECAQCALIETFMIQCAHITHSVHILQWI